METVRDSWTDERLDDLNGQVGSLRTETREEFRSVRAEMKDEFRAVREEMNARFDRLDARFDSMQQTLIYIGGGMATALVGLIATQL